MAVNISTPRVSYAGNDVTDNFAITFQFINPADVQAALVNTVNEAVTPLVLGVDFEVIKNQAPSPIPATGTLFTQIPVPTGSTIVIYSEPLVFQPFVFTEGDPLPAKSTEGALDRATLVAQRIFDQAQRTLRLPVTEVGGSLPEMPTAMFRANKFLAFDASGNPIASDAGIDPNLPLSALGEQIAQAATPGDVNTLLGMSAFFQTLLAAVDAPAVRTLIAAIADPMTTRGDIMVRDASNVLARLGLGPAGTSPVSDGNDLVYAQLIPAGMMAPYGGVAAPSGWLLCDGSTVSRATYANLYAAIGDAFGEGDGADTFHLPDFRGRFLRGVDGGAGRDPNAGARTASATGGNAGDNVGSVQDDAYQGHWHNLQSTTSALASGSSFSRLNAAGVNVIDEVVRDSVTDGVNGTPRVSPETRPKNANVTFIIKT